MTGLAAARATGSRRSWLVAALLAAGVLIVAVAAALGARTSAGELIPGEALAGAVATSLSRLATALPLGYAFAAGMVSAVNPCGFALLPGYLGAYLGSESVQIGLGRRLSRAAVISLTVSASFVLLFAAAGLVVAATAAGAARFFPFIGLAVGVLLVAAGAALLGGRAFDLPLLGSLQDRLGSVARRRDVVGFGAYGMAYAAGSLGCTLPIFLSVVATGFAAGGPISALSQFVLYGLGMGTVLAALTVTMVVLGHTAFRTIRGIGAYLQRTGAVALLLAGAYVVYYWLALGGVLSQV